MSAKTPARKRPGRSAGEPVPLAERVAKSRAALEKRGGAKIPSGWLQPDAAKALDYLHKHAYAPTRTGCIAKAVTEAAERSKSHVGKRSRKEKPS